jgi:hypothetical protein
MASGSCDGVDLVDRHGLAKQAWVGYNSDLPGGQSFSAWQYLSGRGAARLARTVRVGEVGGSNPLAPTVLRL